MIDNIHPKLIETVLNINALFSIVTQIVHFLKELNDDYSKEKE